MYTLLQAFYVYRYNIATCQILMKVQVSQFVAHIIIIEIVLHNQFAILCNPSGDFV